MSKFSIDTIVYSSFNLTSCNFYDDSNYMKYKEYIQNYILTNGIPKMVVSYESNRLGQIDLTIYVNDPGIDSTKIVVDFEVNRNVTIDEIKRNRLFLKFILVQINKYIDMINTDIHIKIPSTGNFLFYNNNLYTKIDDNFEKPIFEKLYYYHYEEKDLDIFDISEE